MTDTEKLALQARIRELREALASAMSDLSYQSTLRDEHQDFSGIIDGIMKSFSRPDDLSALNDYVREEKMKVLLKAKQTCLTESDGYDPSPGTSDTFIEGYQGACMDCACAIERMAEELKC